MSKSIELERVKTTIIEIPVSGVTPLLCNNFSNKAKQEMLDSQMKKAKGAKKAKDPAELFDRSLYHLAPKGKKKRYGLPSRCFKRSMIGACRYVDGLTMTMARGAFFVAGEIDADGDQMIEIVGAPEIRTDNVRNATGVADIRVRSMFRTWTAVIPVHVYGEILSPEQIINLLSIAGKCQGVGDWRPEKGGHFGQFEVDVE